MITRIGIQNFKSLRDVQIQTTRLNFFMGLNGMGKSSILQSLLMLRQSYYKSFSLEKLYINGDLISLGNAKDIFFQDASSDENIQFFLDTEEFSVSFKYAYNAGTDILAGVNRNGISSGQRDRLSIFNDNFHYLEAEHIQPAKTYHINALSDKKINILGNIGENAPFYLAEYGTIQLLNKTLHHPKAHSTTLAHELDAWMGEISPGIRIVPEELKDVDLVKISLQFETKDDFSNLYAPINVGFGISYVLPLILTILISKPGDLVLIENPESHLHPRGQAELGRLLALAAQSGVQILCETHSDHVINGARVAVKNNEIDHKNIKLFYFEKDTETHLETRPISIAVDKNGELDQYPQGLLDEWGTLMAQLL
jgi:predicted ATPase